MRLESRTWTWGGWVEGAAVVVREIFEETMAEIFPNMKAVIT